MYLSKRDRESLRMRYGGCCAYCGNPLGKTWHADHVEPVVRVTTWTSATGYRATGKLNHPERDHIDNLMPACVPCNIDKADHSLESWRKWIEDAHDRLLRNYSAYKHAHRFRMITPSQQPLVFFFERYQQRVPLLVTLDINQSITDKSHSQ